MCVCPFVLGVVFAPVVCAVSSAIDDGARPIRGSWPDPAGAAAGQNPPAMLACAKACRASVNGKDLWPKHVAAIRQNYALPS